MMFKLLIFAMLAIAAIPFFARNRQELLVTVPTYLLAFPVLTLYALESPDDSSSSAYAAAFVQPITIFYVALMSVSAFIVMVLIRGGMLEGAKQDETPTESQTKPPTSA